MGLLILKILGGLLVSGCGKRLGIEGIADGEFTVRGDGRESG